MNREYHVLGTSSDDDKLPHLDNQNANVRLTKDTNTFVDDRNGMPIVSANAYLDIRAIK